MILLTKPAEMPRSQLLEKFGAAFFAFCEHSGYEKMLQTLGGNLKDFLNGIDGLHENLTFLFPGMRSPSLRVTDDKQVDGGLVLHYYSERVGLEYMVVGAVKAVAKKVFNQIVDIQVCTNTSEDCTWSKMLVVPVKTQQKKQVLTSQDKTIQSLQADMKLLTVGSEVGSTTFCRACPFHVIFDNQMVIYQAGISLCRVLPAVKVGITKFNQIFELKRPSIKVTFENILSYINKVYVVTTKEGLLDSTSLTTVSKDDRSSLELPTMRFKGQMIYLPESDSILFLCSPSVLNLDGLNEKGLFWLNNYIMILNVSDCLLLRQV